MQTNRWEVSAWGCEHNRHTTRTIITHMDTHKHTNALTDAHTHTHRRTYTHSHTHTLTHSHTHTHTRTLTHPHTHTSTVPQAGAYDLDESSAIDDDVGVTGRHPVLQLHQR